METCSCGGVVGCLIGVSSVLAAATFVAVAASAMEALSAGLFAVATLAAAAALAVEEASTVCNGAGLSSGLLAEAFALAVSAAAVGTIFLSLCFVVLLQDRVFMVEIQCRY
jgi:hypothetical protein